MSEMENARAATLVALAQKKPGLGRTAHMKLCYFLQTLREVPLGYHFTMYSYGPFDSDVLADLATAEALGGVRSRIVQYPRAYGYEIEPTGRSNSLKELAGEFIKKYDPDIEWVATTFGGFRRVDLELLGTIVYVDREAREAEEELTEADLVRKVHEVKPNFSESYIIEKVAYLRGLHVLQSASAARRSVVGL